MKLYHINESAVGKLSRQAKTALNKVIGKIVKDPDVLYAHLLKGAANIDRLLVEDDKWWEDLFVLLEPIQHDILNNCLQKTLKHIQEQFEAGPRPEVQTESLLAGFVEIFKKVAMAAIATVLLALDIHPRHGFNGLGRLGRRIGSKEKVRAQQIGKINTETVAHFIRQVEPIAEIVLRKQERDKEQMSRTDKTSSKDINEPEHQRRRQYWSTSESIEI